MLPALILPLLNVLGINVFPGQDAWSPTVPFDKNKHYSVSALSILCCCIMISNVLRQTLTEWWVPLPLKSLGYASFGLLIVVSGLLALDTYHRILAMIPKLLAMLPIPKWGSTTEKEPPATEEEEEVVVVA
jgi:hypothetical protein